MTEPTESSGGDDPLPDDAIETSSSRMWLRPDGIIQALVFPDSPQGLAEARENLEVVNRLGAGRRRPVLVDFRQTTRGINREAREYYSGDEQAAVSNAVALLVGSPISRVVGNFFIGLNRPRVPTRLFTNEADAVDWLRGFVT